MDTWILHVNNLQMYWLKKRKFGDLRELHNYLNSFFGDNTIYLELEKLSPEEQLLIDNSPKLKRLGKELSVLIAEKCK